MNPYILETIGWLGSALLIYSVLQSRFLRFRISNGIASGVLVAYNAVVGVWPMVGVNAVLVLIDAYFIWTLLKSKSTAKAFTYVRADAALEDWFTAHFGDDIERFHPGFVRGAADEAVVVFHDERAIGLVAWRGQPGAVGELLLDYVIPAYRDFAPGAYVYSPAGPLRQAGLAGVAIEHPLPAVAAYLTKLGFTKEADGRLALAFEGR